MSAPDYFGSREGSAAALRTRPPLSVLGAGVGTPGSPRSPRTPLLGRSISSQFGSPGSFRVEHEDHVVYELGARHLSAGFAGESRPRCVIRFHPDMARRVGDYRQYDPTYSRTRRRNPKHWAEGYELYCADLRGLDLGLVEDRLERAVRKVHSEFLQLDVKPRKAVLVIPSLLPAPLLEVALTVLFNHYQQPPSVTLLTAPILACVGAGLRDALVIDVGWEEAVVTAVGEYKEVYQRRSVRAAGLMAREMKKMLEDEAQKAGLNSAIPLDLSTVEEVVERVGWCRPQLDASNHDAATQSKTINLPLPTEDGPTRVAIPLGRLSEAVESTLFTSSNKASEEDDQDFTLPRLAYRVLLTLPMDLRAVCMSRIIITGGVSETLGLKHCLLSELEKIIKQRGWDPVQRYGSATSWHQKLSEKRSTNIAPRPPDTVATKASATPTTKGAAQLRGHDDPLPHGERVHDDLHDSISKKAERQMLDRQNESVKVAVRGVKTLGAWTGASLVASLRVKGVREIEREEFLKHGLRDGGAVY